MKRKLLIIPAWYPDDTAPANGIFIEDQAIVLSEKYDVLVYRIQPIIRLDMSFSYLSFKDTLKIQKGIKVYHKPILIAPQFSLSVLWKYYLYKVRQGFKKIIAKWGKPDLIHTHVVLPSGWVAMKLGYDYDIPVVLTEHSGPFSTHLTSPLKRRLTQETLAGVDRVLAVSPALAQHISGFQPDIKVGIVGNVIRTKLFTHEKRKNIFFLSPPQQSFTRFLSVAFLNKQKGIDYLLEATQLLVQRGITKFQIIIGGDGQHRRHLEMKAKSLYKQCYFLGMLTREEVVYWMQQCDVFVLTSLAETFGVVLGEAMSCGKPVIATRCGGPEFIITPETGFLVNVADPVALADVMTKFILKEVSFDILTIRQSILRRFGEKAFVRDLSTIYQEIWMKKNP